MQSSVNKNCQNLCSSLENANATSFMVKTKDVSRDGMSSNCISKLRPLDVNSLATCMLHCGSCSYLWVKRCHVLYCTQQLNNPHNIRKRFES